ncbi:MAG: addiction module protein [Bacteroidetes bacterium]|nr:addiction module protein [Bacteroidota bacterium]MBS1930070.1 addiction module protein [Bacteroidota bacterium]
MTTLRLKNNLHKAIDKIEDENLLKAVYTILEKQMETNNEYDLTPAQQKELERRLANHQSGKSKTYSWKEVKASLLNRKK